MSDYNGPERRLRPRDLDRRYPNDRRKRVSMMPDRRQIRGRRFDD